MEREQARGVVGVLGGTPELSVEIPAQQLSSAGEVRPGSTRDRRSGPRSPHRGESLKRIEMVASRNKAIKPSGSRSESSLSRFQDVARLKLRLCRCHLGGRVCKVRSAD